MLFESEEFDTANTPPRPEVWGRTVFSRCTFDDLELNGIIFGGIMDHCTLKSAELTWALFNVALIARTRFQKCSFRGASFRGSTLVECSFVRCTFELNELGSDCTIDDCLLASCTFDRCTWQAKPNAKKRDITRTRWLDCTQKACKGFTGIF